MLDIHYTYTRYWMDGWIDRHTAGLFT